MSYGDTEPSEFHGGAPAGPSPFAPASRVTFDRRELNRIFSLYGRKVAAGEWRDYAIDFLKDRAVFSVFRRASRIRQWNHNTAQFRPTTGQAEMRVFVVASGPSLSLTPDISAPQPPRSSGRIGPAR